MVLELVGSLGPTERSALAGLVYFFPALLPGVLPCPRAPCCPACPHVTPCCPARRAPAAARALRPTAARTLHLATHTSCPTAACPSRPVAPPSRPLLQPARCAPLLPARRALQPARPTLLPCALRPAAARVSRPPAAQCVMPCSPHVAPCCSLRVVPCCPPRRALLQPVRRAPPLPSVSCPAALLPCPVRAPLPSPARHPALRSTRCPALSPARRAALPLGLHAALPCSPQPCCPALRPARRPALRPARCPALQPATALPCPAACALRCPRALPCSPRAALPLGPHAALPFEPRCPAPPGGGASRARRQKPLLPQQRREWAVQRGATTGGTCESTHAGSAASRRGGSGGGQQQQQRPLETLSPQQLREWAVRWGSPGGGGFRGTRTGGVEAPGGVEATSLHVCDSASAEAEPEEALHTFTLDSGTSRCFFRDSTTVTPLTPLWGPDPCPRSRGRLRRRAFPSSRGGSAPLLTPPTTAPLQTLHMDVWGPARVPGQGGLRYFLLLHVRFREDLPVLRLHSDRGGEFCSHLLEDLCGAKGILQPYTLSASPQHNGTAERCIGIVMKVARISMIDAAAPHFLWLFAVRYAAAQLSLWPRVSHVETSPTSRWTGEFGDASAFRVDPPPLVEPLEVSSDTSGPAEGGDQTAIDTVASRHSTRLAVPPGFPPRPSSPPLRPVAVDSGAAGGGDIRGADSGGAGSGGAASPTGAGGAGGAAAGVSAGGGAGGAGVGGADVAGVDAGGAGAPADSGGAGPRGASAGVPGIGRVGGTGAGGTGTTGGTGGAAAVGAVAAIRWGSPGGGIGRAGAAAYGGAGPGGASVGVPRVGRAGGTGTGGRGATGGTRGAGLGGASAVVPRVGGTGGADTGGTTGGTGVSGASWKESLSPLQLREWAVRWGSLDGGAGGTGSGGAVPTGAGGSGGATTQPQPSALRHLLSLLPAATEFPVAGTTPLLFPPTDQSQPQLLHGSPLPSPAPHTEVTASLTARCEPETRASTPERQEPETRAFVTARVSCVRRPRAPDVPGTHDMTLRPSSVPQRVVLPLPPASSVPHILDLESDLVRAASPIVTRLLATVVPDPSFESATMSALVAELVDFAALCRLDYAASLVFDSSCPPSVKGELALGCDVLEDRQFELEYLAVTARHLASTLLCPEGDPDALDITNPRTYAEAIMGPYSSQWQIVMDAKMVS
ncbi:unnamed protein product [Closterium sp. NIES-54]